MPTRTFFRHPAIAALMILLALTASPARAEQQAAAEAVDPASFYGFWEFQEPAGDTSVVIVKRGGRISCFWAGSATRAIQKGSWERAGESLTARWEAGNVDVFRMLGDNAIERDSFPAGASLLDKPALTIRGVRIDPRLPGSLTVKQEGPRIADEDAPDPQAAPAIPLDSAFVGYWKIDQSKGLLRLGKGDPQFYLHLARNGDATVALRDWDVEKGVRGKWRIDGERVIVTWPNGRRDVLSPLSDGGYSLGTYRPKDDIGDKPQDRAGAQKVQATDAERYFEAGDFKRLTVVDIRGTWIPAVETDRSEYISVEGWGNAFRYPATDGAGGTDPGKWRLQSDRIVITWIDGSKDVIRLSPSGFFQESYSQSEPITGTPARSIKVMRTSEE